MNTFEKLNCFFVTDEHSDESRVKKFTKTIEFLQIMDNIENEELETDDFDWIDDILENADDQIIQDFFKFKASNGNTILHELFDYMPFLDSIHTYSSNIDFTLVGKHNLTPLELAINSVNCDAVSILLDIGAPVTSFRNESLLTDVSFDGREFSDYASNANMELDSYVQENIKYIISLLESKGATISIDAKENAATFNACLSF